MQFQDRSPLTGTRKTADGYLVASAKVARTGIQTYAGSEVGRPDLATVRVFRSEAEVFSTDSMHSFAFRPMTLDHPGDGVTAANWKAVSIGQTGSDVARDGDVIRVPLILMDADAIAAVEAGKRQLSVGYTCDLKWEAGTTPAGETYDAQQTNIRANHLAVVSAARGGPHLKIGDHNEGTNMTIMTVDGAAIEVSDADGAIIKRALAKKDAEIAAARASVLTGDGLHKAVQARLKLEADAKRIAGPAFKTDGLSDAEVRRVVVTKKLGDNAVADKDAPFFDHGFDMLVAQLPAQSKGTTRDSFAESMADTQEVQDQQAIVDKARADMIADMTASRRPLKAE